MLKGPIKRVFSIFELLMEIKVIGLSALLPLYFEENLKSETVITAK